MQELKEIVQAIRKLLRRIEDAVPLINLAITASGANLSSSLPATISPSRLLQASTFLTAGDSQYGSLSSAAAQIGPTFTLSMYMLFQGHLRPQNEEDVRESTWKEVIHKANVRLMRVPMTALYELPDAGKNALHNEAYHANRNMFPAGTDGNVSSLAEKMIPEIRADEYAYQLLIVEDLEDDRVHTFEDNEPQPEPYGDISLAGIREAVPIHELSKIFYADTGKILNIGSEGESNSPVLLLKRDINAVPPRRMMHQYGNEDSEFIRGEDVPIGDGHSVVSSEKDSTTMATVDSSLDLSQRVDQWRLPQDLDPEWIAFEVYTEADDSDTEVEAEVESSRPSQSSRSTSAEPSIVSEMSRLSVNGISSASSLPKPASANYSQIQQPSLPPIRTSLSLLEMLLRLLSLQQFQQTPHLSIPDELLTFFLSESASTGAASNDAQERKRLREEARRRVGFDPYDESPVKRRGEEYQYGAGSGGSEQWHSAGQHYSEDAYSSPLRYEDEGYGTKDWRQSSHERQPSTPKSFTPQTPLLLKNRSRSGTPQSPSVSSDERPQPLSRWSSSLRSSAAGRTNVGSPLARPTTGMTDEALGTSPASSKEVQKKG